MFAINLHRLLETHTQVAADVCSPVTRDLYCDNAHTEDVWDNQPVCVHILCMSNIVAFLGNGGSYALIQNTHGSVGLDNLLYHARMICNSHTTRKTWRRKVEKCVNSGERYVEKECSERKKNSNRKK